MKVKYKSIQNVIRLQEKIEDLNKYIHCHYQNVYVVSSDKYILEYFFLAFSFLGFFFNAGALLFSLIIAPFYFHYLRVKEYALLNKLKLKIQSKNKLNSGSYSKIIWLIFQKYGFIDNEMIRYINEFEETLNDFEKRNIKHFFKYKNNTVYLNNINNVFYNVAVDYISNTPIDKLIENKSEVYSFIDKVGLDTLQDELLTLFNNRIKVYFNQEDDKKINRLKLKFEESRLDEDLIKRKKSQNKIIKNI